MNDSLKVPGFFARLSLSLKVLFDPALAAKLESLAAPQAAPKVEAKEPPEKVHGAGLTLLAALQREGRFVDFVQQDLSSFSDEEIGAAARVVHGGCRKFIKQYLEVHPVLAETEGATVTVPKGFDPQKIRVTGNIAGDPPYRGSLKHHGWQVSRIDLPTLSEAIDRRVLAPAEVELS